jgi:DNA-binding GntR family transcriptional regulator
VSPLGAKTRAVAVADALRDMIRSGELAPGAPLRQDHLAQQFGVSSTPVREALAILVRERLVRHDPHRGAIVFPPTDADIRENFEIRLALEPLATRLAAEHRADATVAHLRELLPAVDAAVAAADPAAYEQADRAFHLAIFAAAERPQLLEMITALRDATVAWAHLHTSDGIDAALLARLHAQHAQLVDAIADQDGDRAHALAADHVWLTAEGSGAA